MNAADPDYPPAPNVPVVPDYAAPKRSSIISGDVLYPKEYTWFVFLSATDVMFTWTILFFGGGEVNWLAAWVIRHYNLYGLVALKFASVLVVLVICEIV